MANRNPTALAGIEYHGVAGATKECLHAALRLLLAGPKLARARILTFEARHAILLETEIGDRIAIMAGFASGHGGTGHAGLSQMLQLFNCHGVQIDEIEIAAEVLERLNRSGLQVRDLKTLTCAEPILPSRWDDYLREQECEETVQGTLWQWMPRVMPYTLLDPRLIGLAMRFEDDPDRSLTLGYRRLEDAIRKRTGSQDIGAKLFSGAFLGDASPLTWPGDEGEAKGRANLFTAIFMAYRNPRAHREIRGGDALSEFLLLNQLFKLEATAEPRTTLAAPGAGASSGGVA